MLVRVLRIALCCASVSTALWTPTGLLVGSSVARAAAALGEGVLVDAEAVDGARGEHRHAQRHRVRAEAEHHQRALSGIPLTRHRVDHQAQRYGVLTTEEVSWLTVDMIGVVISSSCTT